MPVLSQFSCQKWNFSQFQDFDILTYEISKTTEPIELKFSGVTEGINKLAVLKVSKQSDKFEEKSKNMELWEINTLGTSYGLAVLLFNH